MSRLMPVDALRIRGIHNALNALAALQLARCLDLGWGAMLRTLREYAGEPHRAAFVRQIGGVDYINDSKGTNVGATVAALEGLGQPVVLIAGGQGKGQDFSPLIPVVSRHARAVMLIGVDGPEIGRVLAPTGVNCITVDSLHDAVRGAAELAQPGDAVLLSPACASLDMFRNSPHRGQRWHEPDRRSHRQRQCRTARPYQNAQLRSAAGHRGVDVVAAWLADGVFGVDRAGRRPALRVLRALLLRDPPRPVRQRRAACRGRGAGDPDPRLAAHGRAAVRGGDDPAGRGADPRHRP
ncbi:hypothetical protein G6F35_013640 [Rhizopus arrhizus]|nr:hypothetical protein G6F35_013640 [Rhizopus arrhizus]